MSPTQSSAIFLHKGNEEFKQFWSDFFDLFDIFGEKQFHIIEPFLIKLRSTKFHSVEATSWLMVLVKKLLNHDNRMLAKDGLTVFLETSLLQANLNRDPVYMKFMQNVIFPVLKDRVGWILPEPKDLFAVAEKLGTLVKLLQPEDCSTSPILQLVIDSETDMSPVATYFFILVCSFNLSGNTINNSDEDILSKLENNLKIINYSMMYRLTSVDKFLKTKIQQIFIDIVIGLFTDAHCIEGLSLHMSKYEPMKDKYPKFQSLYSELLYFLGALDLNVLLASVPKVSCLVKPIDQESEPFQDSSMTSLLASLEDCPVKSKGFFRLLTLHISSYAVSSSLGTVELLLKNKLADPKLTQETEFIALVDFTQFLVDVPSDHVDLELITALIGGDSTWGLVTLMENFKDGHVTLSDFIVRLGPLLKIAANTNIFYMFEPELLTKFLEVVNGTEMSSFHICSSVIISFMVNYFSTNGKVEDLPETRQVAEFLLGDSSTVRSKLDVKRRNELLGQFNVLRLHAIEALLLEDAQLDENSYFRSEANLKRVLELAFDLVETGSSDLLPIAIKVINSAVQRSFELHYLTNVELTSEFMELIWKGVKELHKTEHFWDAFDSFSALICNPSFSGWGILTTYATKVFELSENISGLPFLLTERLNEVDLEKVFGTAGQTDFRQEFLNVCIQASCFGPIVAKSMKLTFNIWGYLCATESSHESLNYDCRLSLPFNGNAKSRLSAVLNISRYVRTVCNHRSEENTTVLENVVKKLLELNEGDSVDKRRYFTGSYVHRFKQRIVQVLLTLQPSFDVELARSVMKTLMMSLGRDGPQASVRYITEWIVINILLQFPELHPDFIETSLLCFQLRPGFGCLFATIVLHTSVNLSPDSEDTIRFFDVALQNLTGLLMGQNFTVRIYGNIALCNMFEQAVQWNLSSILSKYEVVYTCAKEAVATAAGNFRKIYENVSNDFYLKMFSPREQFFYDVVFIHLPRIAKMCSDEIIHENDLRHTCSLVDPSCESCPRGQRHNKLRFMSPSSVQNLYKDDKEYTWHLKANLVDGREHGEEQAEVAAVDLPEGTPGNVLQVKGNPWKYLPVSDELLDFPEEFQLKKKSREDGLVVVASLIDRIPNLGGLCRTCEVFGASKYIISSLKILDDQQFKSLSVSAHRWVDILEVPVQDLRQLLSSYSIQGYTIVGVEQALESCTLNTFAFPKKTLLLLGNEKYGIPTDLLSLVDNCIEIPQVGLIRSLNVHVTGALCIWHYALQHVI
ncbi:unnamed protein product [Allacma fusca]|uniref:tRNA/rRNA methyltransferase SpoU type domain-containing protein n=1 Tax=Allacma fusca TaxID=39272 RepID=A0A8J2M7T6_9HEXA|nr:unnamed protein product [Allacma fusca]